MNEKSNLTVKKVILDKWETKIGYMFDYKDLHELECVINQFENHITYLNDKNQQLKKQLEYIRSGEYYNQLRFERDMLQNIVDNGEVSKEDREFIDCTHRNTELLEDRQEVIDYLKEKIIMFDENINERFEDYDVYVVGKKALEETINIYKDKIIKMYEHLKNNEGLTDKEIIEKYEEHLQEYRVWWTRLNAINLNENTDCICDSWLYEHQIFELVRLYKTIDFEEYDLLFLGW